MRPGRAGVARSGLDVLEAERFRPLRGRRVGLVCNPTAVTRGSSTPPTCSTAHRA